MKIDDSGTITVRRSITIARSEAELYAVWRDPERLAALLTDVVQVTPAGPGRTHWSMHAVVGTTEWDAVLVEDDGSRALEWRAVDGSALANRFRIELAPAPGNQGTEVTLTLRFVPPGGVLGEALEKLFAVPPDVLIGKMLYRFRAYAQTGEIPTLRYNSAHREYADQPGEQK
ncbi:MAG: SRPBCC family protein [Proteobacteria bacterium]|nr:MAG: SRPBCC family protein [Pseudomonadota bacterium]